MKKYSYLISLALLIQSLMIETAFSQTGTLWTARSAANGNNWRSVTFGNGVFVAVATTGTGNRVMTSTDGVNWISRTSAADNNWFSVTFGNGLFVAVATNGTNRVMTSPDGITWTARISADELAAWNSVTYGNGLYVAVASSTSSATPSNLVMTSSNGITWTIRTAPNSFFWRSVTFGNGLFVAVAGSGTGNQVMTSTDGITWTARTSAADNSWNGVTFGNGLFVAIASSGIGNRVMTSPNGINWTTRTSAADNGWNSVTYGNGLFVAVSSTGTGNRVMTSPDGITWTARTSAADNAWFSVTAGSGIFVAVASNGTSRVMTSGVVSTLPVSLISFEAWKKEDQIKLSWKTSWEENNKGFHIQRSTNGRDFKNIGFMPAQGARTGSSYSYLDQQPNEGLNFYRLLQEDIDGKITYSPVRKANWYPEKSIRIFPNPVAALLTVDLANTNSNPLEVRINDFSGRVIRTLHYSTPPRMLQIDVQRLPDGNYNIELVQQGDIRRLPFLKNSYH